MRPSPSERRSLLVPALAALIAVLAIGAFVAVLGSRSPPPRPAARAPDSSRIPSRSEQPPLPSDLSPPPALEPASAVDGDAVFAGRVVDADGRPAPGATVRLEDAARGTLLKAAVSADDGTFRLALDWSGAVAASATLALVAQKDGLVSERLGGLAPAPGLRLGELRLTLAPGAHLVGTVRDAADLRSVSACAVVVRGATLACDHAGRFTLGPLAPGPVALRIAAPGFAPREVSVELRRRERAAVDVLLTRGASLSGVVRDPDRRPVGGASVRSVHYSIAGANVAEVSALTDESGTFVLDGVAPGLVSVRAAVPGYAEAASEELHVAAGERRDGLEVVLGTGGALLGSVVRAGAPVPDAQIELLRLSDRALAARAVTAADGTFRLDGLTPGAYTAIASAGEARALASGVTIIEREETSVTLLLGDDAIRGRVTDPLGKPVAGALVSVTSSYAGGLGSRTAGTGVDGTFTIDGLVGAPFRVEARAGGASAEARGVQAGAEVELVLAATGRLEGVVADDAGRGLTDFVLTVTPTELTGSEGIASRFRSRRILSPDGGFAFDELPAGAYEVRASAPGHASAREKATVRAGGTTTVRLAVGAGATLSGRTVREGRPVAGCRVREARQGDDMWGRADSGLREVVTGPDGGFTLSGLAPGGGAVWASCPEARFGHARYQIAAGEHRRDLVLELRQGRDEPPEEFGGVGAGLQLVQGRVRFMSLIEGGPAHLAGIAAGDEIVAVDGWRPPTGAPLAETIQRIRGPLGTPVAFVLRRGERTFHTVAERVRIAR